MGLKRFFQNLIHVTAGVHPTLDLHGLSVKEALGAAAKFVETSFHSGISPIRIVYGKGLGSRGGRGILREVIPRWCEKEGKIWVESIKREVDLKGGDGSMLLFLRKQSTPENPSKAEKSESASPLE